jgi:IS30 family transposase
MKKVRWTERKKLFNKIVDLRNQGYSDSEIVEQLNQTGFKTYKGNEFQNHNIHQFIYTCKKAGMRETKQRGPRQMPLTAHTQHVEQSINHQLTTPQKPTNNTDQIQFIADVGAKIQDEQKRKQVIAALVGALL